MTNRIVVCGGNIDRVLLRHMDGSGFQCGMIRAIPDSMRVGSAADLALLRKCHLDQDRLITRIRAQVVELAPSPDVLNSPCSLLYGLIEPTERGILVSNDGTLHRVRRDRRWPAR